jgi:hypothetical protein
MYVAPLNYDRFFRKIFSDEKIEDFLEVKIEEFECLKEPNLVTNDASVVEFDFRCKIKNTYVIIDMQHWYKRDISQRFYLYHALNSGLQPEKLPLKRFAFPDKPKKTKMSKDYRELEPVLTLIWMVMDNLNFSNDYVSFLMAPEIVLDFLNNDQLWHEPKIKELLEERKKVLEVVRNNTRNLDFLPQNHLVFMFQKNIVKNKLLKKYLQWFDFAETTRNENNEKEDFVKYQGDVIFSEIIRRLRRDDLTAEDFAYIEDEKKTREEIDRLERGIYEDGKKDGEKIGIEKGKKIYFEKCEKIGIEKGEKIGIEKGREEIALNMINHGFDIEVIAQITGFSLSTLEIMKKENHF